MNIQQNINAGLGLGAVLSRGTLEYKTQEKEKEMTATEQAAHNIQMKKFHEDLESAHDDYVISSATMDKDFADRNYAAHGRLSNERNKFIRERAQNHLAVTDRYHDLLKKQTELDPSIEASNKLALFEADMGEGSHYYGISQEFERIKSKKAQLKEKAMKDAQADLGMAQEEAANSRMAVAKQIKIMKGGKN